MTACLYPENQSRELARINRATLPTTGELVRIGSYQYKITCVSGLMGTRTTGGFVLVQVRRIEEGG